MLPDLDSDKTTKFNELVADITDLTKQFKKASDVDKKTIQLEVQSKLKDVKDVNKAKPLQGRLNKLTEEKVIKSLVFNIDTINGQYNEKNYKTVDGKTLGKEIGLVLAKTTGQANSFINNQ